MMIEQVELIKFDSYLFFFWKKYYFFEFDKIFGQDVIFEWNGEKFFILKDQVKVLIFMVDNYQDLIGYKVFFVEWVEILFVFQRKDMNGVLFDFGDRVKFYLKGENIIVVDGYFEFLLFLVGEGGLIFVSEFQSQFSLMLILFLIFYSESYFIFEFLGGVLIFDSSSVSDFYFNSQFGSQSFLVSYFYSVNFVEILKVIVVGKIQVSDEVKVQFQNYGWEFLNFEKNIGFQLMFEIIKIMVIVKVFLIFVLDIFENENVIIIVKVII